MPLAAGKVQVGRKGRIVVSGEGSAVQRGGAPVLGGLRVVICSNVLLGLKRLAAGV